MNLDLFDREITKKIAVFNSNSFLFKIAAFFAHSGDSWFWCAGLFLIWLFAKGEMRRTLAFWGLSIAITAVVIFFVKKIIRRKRPKGEWGGIYRQTDPHSFPSGHAVRAGIIGILAVNTFGFPVALLFFLWGLLMSFSRIITGVHYFLDVIGGLVIGFLVGMALVAAQPWFYEMFPFVFDFSFRQFFQ